MSLENGKQNNYDARLESWQLLLDCLQLDQEEEEDDDERSKIALGK